MHTAAKSYEQIQQLQEKPNAVVYRLRKENLYSSDRQGIYFVGVMFSRQEEDEASGSGCVPS